VTPGIQRRSTRRWNGFGESELKAGNAAETQYAALTCPKAIIHFTAAESLSNYCEIGYYSEMKICSLFSQGAFDWLNETLSRS
jgi:hypothetical protein